MLLEAVALLAHALFAWWCARRLLPEVALAQRCGVAAVLAAGSASASAFWQIQVCGGWDTRWQFAELLLVMPWWAWRSRFAPAPAVPWPRRHVAWLSVLAALAVAQVVLHWRAGPTGSYDATANWNLRARAVVLAPERWSELFANQPGIPHADYPMAVSLLVARLWRACGAMWPQVPFVVGVLAAVASVLVVGGAVSRWRGATAGALVSGLLLAAPELWRQAIAQCADVPVALVFAVAAVLGCHALRKPLAWHGWLVCGVALGVATWVKNEALLFGLLFAGLALLSLWRRTGVGVAFRAGVVLALGALPFVVTVAVHKQIVPQPNELLPFGRLHEVWQACLDLQRWRLGAAEVGRRVVGHGHFLFLAGLAATPWLRGGSPMVGTVLLGGVFVSMVLGHFAVALTTPYDQAFHIATTQTRLLLQLWPLSALLLGGCWGRAVEDDSPA